MVQEGDLIVMTGCSGRIGSKLTKRFLDAGCRIVGIDVIPPKTSHERLFYMNIDLSSDEKVAKGFAEIREKHGDHIISFIHLAAYYSFSGDKPELYDIITVQGTRRVLNECKKGTCEQFFFSSTQLVHAPCEVGERINEDSPILPKWDYPKSKVKTEKLIHEQRGTIPSMIFRIVGCYDDECHSIPLSNQIQRIYERSFESHVYSGHLNHGAPFIHFDDLTDAVWRAVERRKDVKEETVLLIGEDKTMSYAELQNEMGQLLFGKDWTTIRLPKAVAKMGAWIENHLPGGEKKFVKPWMIDLADDHWELDISRAKRVLGWEPKTSIKATLPKMLAFLKANPEAFYHENGLNTDKLPAHGRA